MLKKYHYFLLLIWPYLLLIGVNESVRPNLEEKPYSTMGVTAMNSDATTEEKCTWKCHNDTKYCMTHHVKVLKPVMGIVNVFYFGLITVLRMFGNYGAANLLFLVTLWPLAILFGFAKIIDNHLIINNLSKSKNSKK